MVEVELFRLNSDFFNLILDLNVLWYMQKENYTIYSYNLMVIRCYCRFTDRLTSTNFSVVFFSSF